MHTDKYSIAWFKIAECISRGEKERALGVYRLLSHSFNDMALSYQLEADIYLCCQEPERAIELYKNAAQQYNKTQRFLEAAAVSEHLATLAPTDMSVRVDVILYHVSYQAFSKIYEHVSVLLKHARLSEEVLRVIEKIVDVLTQRQNEKEMSTFLSHLESCNKEVYDYAYTYAVSR
jgi:hypothetical protein